MIQPSQVREHYDQLAAERASWFNRNIFFHSEILRYCRFFIPDQSRVLELGCGTGDLLAGLNPSYGVGVDVSPQMTAVASQKYPHLKFVTNDVEKFESQEKFDYVLISGTLGSLHNIQGFLKKISSMMTNETRIVISYYNELWGPILRVGERMGWKMPEIIANWLSVEDIANFLELSGYQVVRRDYLMLCPIRIPFVTSFINKIIGNLPILRRLSLTHLLVARPNRPFPNPEELTASIVLTCRDEEDNIQGLVEGIPQLGKHTEIIFVEGHSKDRTVEKIQEMIKKYPEKDIKLFKQKGIGQGDAFRLGFDMAKGDLLCWMEADLTIDPKEIALFWETYVSGKGEYINGTRFIYQMEKNSMPFFNFIGNRFFGNIFTIILEQRFTDTLCGFKAVSRKNYQKIKKDFDYFGDFDPFGDFQLIFGAIKHGLKVAEIPVHYSPRRYGESKAYGKSFLSFIKHALILFRMSWFAFIKIKLF